MCIRGRHKGLEGSVFWVSGLVDMGYGLDLSL